MNILRVPRDQVHVDVDWRAGNHDKILPEMGFPYTRARKNRTPIYDDPNYKDSQNGALHFRNSKWFLHLYIYIQTKKEYSYLG